MRLKVYSHLQKLGEQVLYYDTDSVIYKWRDEQTEIETGDFLGDMKDELNGDHIIEFVSGGPKNYAYRTAEKKFDRVLQRSEQQFDRIKQKYDKPTSGID